MVRYWAHKWDRRIYYTLREQNYYRTYYRTRPQAQRELYITGEERYARNRRIAMIVELPWGKYWETERVWVWW